MARSEEAPGQFDLERRVGHPGEQLDYLKERVQAEAVREFRSIEDDWLRLMWTLDAYRIAGVPPREMGKQRVPGPRRLGRVASQCAAENLFALGSKADVGPSEGR